MIGEGYTVSSLSYIVFLCLISGFLILQADARGYKAKAMNKEKKVSRVIGWLNIVFGLLMLIGMFVL
ncbi:hypothetical protein L1N85_00635 [Paenibacillus alkaliterrae]|uniref:CLC_0170 family protein n=1 Tax=Paenibacillus alkaliterrae TaxID=320909 RepID=UPI001F4154EF|nr:CLC_0170 family protein [Paenibacillus alkaliterrae]MCF2936934.1 hypothetical protein [Paenibacillus alkaliterrae]